jgi:hypothetical protein
MQVQKLRGAADVNGLIPAGQFFAQLAAKLEDANVRDAARQAELDEEDRALELTYRKRSAARMRYAAGEQHAIM